jgi:hypothetical protein
MSAGVVPKCARFGELFAFFQTGNCRCAENVSVFILFLKKHFFSRFFTVFYPQNKAKPVLNTLIESMRDLRILAPDACYSVRTGVNNREPLFWVARERTRFMRVLDEAHVLYAFVLYGLCFDGPWVSFYIKPAYGLQLPEIMQWIKQTYACRYNVYDGRTGHIWGDRYESVIVDGPPEDAKEYVFAAVVCEAASRKVRRAVKAGSGGAPVSGGLTVSPATGAEGRPHTGETARKGG